MTSLVKEGSASEFLFGLQGAEVGGVFANRPKVTMFVVLATKLESSSPDDQARKAASVPGGQDVKSIEIGGKKFWESDTQQKVPEGKIWGAAFATAVNGYILQLNIQSFDKKTTVQLENCIEAIAFFDPSKAEEMAGSGSQPYSVSRNVNIQIPASSRINELHPGTVFGNIYRNNTLGFEYRFPMGWVANDKATQDRLIEAGHQLAWGDSPSAARDHEDFEKCARLLLDVTNDPPLLGRLDVHERYPGRFR